LPLLAAPCSDRLRHHRLVSVLGCYRHPRRAFFPTRRSSDLHHHDGNLLPRRVRPAVADQCREHERQRRQHHDHRQISRSPRTVVDRKSTRLNSSHVSTSYAVFCLKKKSTEGTVNLVGGVGTP